MHKGKRGRVKEARAQPDKTPRFGKMRFFVCGQMESLLRGAGLRQKNETQ